MGGHTVPTVLAGLPVDLVPMYFELDGTFPNHEANPLDPANLVDLQERVRAEGADIGLAFDGDADRCFVVDERGEPVSPSAVTALVAVRELAKHPGATVIHNLITSRAVPEIVARARRGPGAHPGRPLLHQGRDGAHRRGLRRRALGALLLPRLLAGRHRHARRAARPQRARRAGRARCPRWRPAFERYVASGEINSEVADAGGRDRRRSARAYADLPGVAVDDLDGLTVDAADWWFNLRPSNTEPLLRLNVEAADEATMAAVRDDVLAVVRGGTPAGPPPATT